MTGQTAAGIASEFFVEDEPGALVSASRLGAIIGRIHAGQSLSSLQEKFLEDRGYHALLGLARGDLDPATFAAASGAEQAARAAEKSALAHRVEEEARLRQAETDRNNARFFAAAEQKRAKRKLFDDFDIGYVEHKNFARVRQILLQVVGGTAVSTVDLTWLAAAGRQYWTDPLRRAHHRILAQELTQEWRETGDLRKAVNACAQWRKADKPAEGLEIIQAALKKGTSPKLRSALLTTGGGAFRDLGQFDDAIRNGTEAHGLTPDDFRPCTLLGAVHIEMGDYAEGAAWYEKAEARGAERDLIDREIHAILVAAKPEDRNAIRAALKKHNAMRFKHF
ncbi:hypothetical protein [Paracoccus sp. IB05]|uniref:hypothetical protein n=1 Tax=Paracoccus sp. IB05 TaxID=2779367 RepID=UPI0018E8C3DC|nr:hypothetical protein [Paracoccus sp. IB05]MBJ2152672.1 hypothetical protein [Paracoccus sp. IB05]